MSGFLRFLPFVKEEKVGERPIAECCTRSNAGQQEPKPPNAYRISWVDRFNFESVRAVDINSMSQPCLDCVKPFAPPTLKRNDGLRCRACYRKHLQAQGNDACVGCRAVFALDEQKATRCKACLEKQLADIRTEIAELAEDFGALAPLSMPSAGAEAVGGALPTPKNRAKLPVPLRRQVWRQFFGLMGVGTCPVCRISEMDMLKFECGHDVAHADGGADRAENLVPICDSCNKSMGTQTFAEFVARIGGAVPRPAFDVKGQLLPPRASVPAFVSLYPVLRPSPPAGPPPAPPPGPPPAPMPPESAPSWLERAKRLVGWA